MTVPPLTLTYSVHMQLFEQCLFTPAEAWHTQVLGNIFSIADNTHKPYALYPEGAGRIDHDRVVRLTGMGGGLVLTYHTNNQTYFGFDTGRWNTLTKDDGKGVGFCDWTGKWTKDVLACDETKGGEFRVSDS
jgi:hypothetical protein